MANFDENHPDVEKREHDYYNPVFTPWTMGMERVVLEYLAGTKEQVLRGAKMAPLGICLSPIQELLRRKYGVSVDRRDLLIRIEQMECRYDWWDYVLNYNLGVYRDERHALVCIDTTQGVPEGIQAGSRRFILYDLLPMFYLMKMAFTRLPRGDN